MSWHASPTCCVITPMSNFFVRFHLVSASQRFWACWWLVYWHGHEEFVMRAVAIVAALSICMAGQALAQANYPEQIVRILVGFSPGVAPDITGRLLAERLSNA